MLFFFTFALGSLDLIALNAANADVPAPTMTYGTCSGKTAGAGTAGEPEERKHTVSVKVRHYAVEPRCKLYINCGC